MPSASEEMRAWIESIEGHPYEHEMLAVSHLMGIAEQQRRRADSFDEARLGDLIEELRWFIKILGEKDAR